MNAIGPRGVTSVQMLSGACVDLAAPDLTFLTLTDVATSLSRLPRFNGHTTGAYAYSVAQHCCFVLDLLRDQPAAIQRAGLLHDAHEALMGDIATPVKASLGESVRALEDRLVEATFVRFGQAPAMARHWAVVQADLIALSTERRDLLRVPVIPWGRGLPAPADVPPIVAWPASTAQARWMGRARTLGLTVFA